MLRRVFTTAATAIIVVAALSLACWFVFSAITGATLITFRTGSMSPTMPQGAVAVSIPVQASDIEVGDVVTVQRAGESMPVTHRVIEISEVPPQKEHNADIRAAAPGSGPPDLTSTGARQIVMQGDDNDTPDHLPYALTDARKVVASVPFVGTALMMLQTPLAMGALILLAGAFVVWAFWPRPAGQDEGAEVPDPPRIDALKAPAQVSTHTPRQHAEEASR